MNNQRLDRRQLVIQRDTIVITRMASSRHVQRVITSIDEGDLWRRLHLRPIINLTTTKAAHLGFFIKRAAQIYCY